MDNPLFWYLKPVSVRLTKAELQEIARLVPTEHHGEFAEIPTTKAALLAFIEAARSRYRNEAAATPSPSRQRRGMCKITATEVNEWLRSLPAEEV